jgi:hypothetical protein
MERRSETQDRCATTVLRLPSKSSSNELVVPAGEVEGKEELPSDRPCCESRADTAVSMQCRLMVVISSGPATPGAAIIARGVSALLADLGVGCLERRCGTYEEQFCRQ